jgi:hypothetical protein
MRKTAAVLAVWLCTQTPAVAQSLPTESVTVTGAREAAIAKFIQSRAAVTRMTGKLARWKTPICPMTYGIPANFAKFVTDKVKQVAQEAGAKTNSDPACRTNIQIVFTTSPQALMDNIRKEHPIHLGYHDNSSQAEQMTQLKRPVHAFYTTQTADYRGQRQTDTSKPRDTTVTLPGMAIVVPAIGVVSTPMTTMQSQAPVRSACRARASWATGFPANSSVWWWWWTHRRSKRWRWGALADHIALLALSQPNDFDTCQDLPSIANLMIAPACDAANTPAALSAHDLAYLRGLYKTQIDGAGRVQKAQIIYQMKQAPPEK